MFVAALLAPRRRHRLRLPHPTSMTVSPQQFLAPTNLIIRVRVEPDSVNRELEVVAESREYYRSNRTGVSSEPRS